MASFDFSISSFVGLPGMQAALCKRLGPDDAAAL
jgi:hypothetical protein